MKCTRVVLGLGLWACVTALAGTGSAQTNTWTSNGPNAGYVKCLAIDSITPTTVYAGIDRSVFKTTDGALTWAPIYNSGTSPLITPVYEIAVDPVLPSTLYLAERGYNVTANLSKSTNGGTTWSPLPLPGDQPVNVIRVAPGNHDILYAGTGHGVFKSTDGGTHWAEANTGIATDTRGINALAIDPLNAQTVYANGKKAYGGWQYKTTDGGGHWTLVRQMGTPADIESGEAMAVGADIHHTVYLATCSQGVVRSIDGGATWILSNTGIARPGCAGVVTVDPGRPSVVYTTSGTCYQSTNAAETWTELPGCAARGLSAQQYGVDPTNPANLIIGTPSNAVLRSTDGGLSFAAASVGLPKANVAAVGVDPLTPTTLYAGVRGSGVYKSQDGGLIWNPINAGFGAQYVTTVVVDPTRPSNVYVGTDGDQGAARTTNGGTSWTSMSVGSSEVFAFAIDPATPTTVYAGAIYPGQGVYKSSDGGGHWAPAGLQTAKVVGLAIDPHGPSTVYAATNDKGLFKSTDGGGTWADAGLTTSAVNAVVVDPGTSSTLYVATYQGVFKSINGAADWVPAITGLTSLQVNALAIDPTAPTTVYAATNGGVFVSNDGGGTWTAMNAGLTELGIRRVAIDPLTPARLHAATGRGVFTFNQQQASATGTATAIVSSVNPSQVGQPVTLTATASPVSGTGTPTGTMQFKVDGVAIGVPVSLSGGRASLTLSTLTAGTHSVTALYTGDTHFSPSLGLLAGGQLVGASLAVTGVTPAAGVTTGGTAVTISGTGFVFGSAVTFGGATATNVRILDPTTITATTPAHAEGLVPVVVRTPDGQTATWGTAFFYAWKLIGTIVLSNETPGYLITTLVTTGYGSYSFYDGLLALQSTSDPSVAAAIPDTFLAALAMAPPGSPVFTVRLSQRNTPGTAVAVALDGTVETVAVRGSTYEGRPGTATISSSMSGVGSNRFTYTTDVRAPLAAWTVSTPSGTIVYQVSAVGWAPSSGAPTFTDDPLQAGTTGVKAVHITELRQRIDEVRTRHGLGAFGWTDATLVPGVTMVKRVHLTELRTALNEAYVAAGRPAPSYTTPTIVAGATVIAAVHVVELRAAVVGIW
jgi:hypothetical protein